MQAYFALIADTGRTMMLGENLALSTKRAAWMDIGFFLLHPDAVVLSNNGWIDVKDLLIGEENLIMAHCRLLHVKL